MPVSATNTRSCKMPYSISAPIIPDLQDADGLFNPVRHGNAPLVRRLRK